MLRAEFVAASTPETGREHPRRTVKLVADAWAAGHGVPAIIHNLSRTGMMIESDMPLASGEPIEIILPRAGTVEAEVIWARAGIAGCRFVVPIPQSVMSAALLLSPPARVAPTYAPFTPPARRSEIDSSVAIVVLMVLAIAVLGLLVVLMNSPSVS